MASKEGKGPIENGATVKKLNLKANVRRKKNERDPEISIGFDTYRGYSSTRGMDLADTICTNANLGHTRPGHLSIGVLEGEPNTLVGTPVLTEDESTLKIRWDEKNHQVVMDMTDALALMHFQVPVGSRAHIPLSGRNLAGFGPSILFHFGQATFETIRRRSGSRKAK